MLPLLLLGCSSGDPASAPTANEAPAGSPASPGAQSAESAQSGGEASLDDLRALPYTGFSPAGEDRDKAGVVALDRGRSEPGYNLTTHRSLCTAELLSATGRTLGRWRMDGCRHWSNSRLLGDGDLLVIGMDDHDDRSPYESRFLARLAWDGTVRWKHTLPVHHDAAPIPIASVPQEASGGALLALGAAYRDDAPDWPPSWLSEELSERPPGKKKPRLYDNRLLLLDSAGAVVAERSVYDLFRAGPYPFDFQPVAPKKTQDGTRAVDLFHLNSVQWNPYPELADRDPLYGAGHVLLCSRHQDTVAVVRWSTGELVWAWGQGILSGPHDASWLPNGHLLIFDNGLERGWSRVLEVDPLGGEAHRGEVVWEYRTEEPEDFFTLSRGSAQRLAGGNTLVAESDRGRSFEVTPGGEIVWEYFSPYINQRDERATIVRMRRYPPQLIDRLRRDLGAPALAPPPDAESAKDE
ncbi:MAG: arylsulfotransferase family protein [Acidobacteriota bacterium]|nr:arylsulfotransferase family protein [Acidobacteriota bacterium]